MTAGQVYDVDGNPVYIAMAPGFTDAAGPAVGVLINGHESAISAREAWQCGMALVRLVAAVREKPGAVVHGLAFSCGSSPEVMLAPEVSDEIGACLMGAAISAVNDMAIWQYLAVPGHETRFHRRPAHGAFRGHRTGRRRRPAIRPGRPKAT